MKLMANPLLPLQGANTLPLNGLCRRAFPALVAAATPPLFVKAAKANPSRKLSRNLQRTTSLNRRHKLHLPTNAAKLARRDINFAPFLL
jgi:hypothetical protein